MTTSSSDCADEDELRRCMERVVASVCTGAPAMVGLHRSRSNFSTSYDTHVVSANLASGEEIKVFMKDFGRSVRPKDDAAQRREREVRVYRDLLPEADLGTARYYASVADEARGRFWLFLEFVDGEPVGYCDLGSWAPAVRALGRLHAYFAERADRLLAHDFLKRHDADFYWSTAEDALDAVARIAPRLTDRLRYLVNRYRPIVEVMAAQPPTLVHGGCRPSNILINVRSDPSRACIVDWEEAGIGAPLLDVAYLLDGVEPPTLDRLLDAYREGAGALVHALPSAADRRYVIECFRLHMTMNSLSRAVLKGYDETAVEKLLAVASRSHDAIRPRSVRAGRA